MRRLFNLPAAQQRRLGATFNELLLSDCYDVPPNFSVVAVSVFDHWLTEAEAAETLDDINAEQENSYYKAHRSFLDALIDRYSCYTYRFRGRATKRYIQYKGFYDAESIRSYVKPSHTFSSSRFHFRLILDEASAVYVEGYDFTNYLYIPSGSDISDLQNLIIASDLHPLVTRSNS